MGNGVRVSFPTDLRGGSAVVPPRFRRGSVRISARFRRGSARFRAVPRPGRVELQHGVNLGLVLSHLPKSVCFHSCTVALGHGQKHHFPAYCFAG